MIVLSLVLVIAAAVLLVLGVFQDGLELIYLSIGSCLLAMALLGVGVILRRRESSSSEPARTGAAATAGGATAAVPPRARTEDATLTDGPDRDATVRVQPVKKAVVRKPAEKGEQPEPAATSEPFAPERDAATSATGGAAAQRRRAGKKAVVKKAVVKKAVVRKTSATGPEGAAGATSADAAGTASDRPAAGSAPAKKATAKKATAKKATAKKATAKKATAKKATAKKASAGGAAGLGDVKGLGPAKRDALLERFGNEQGLRDASIEELTRVRGVGPGLARSIKDALR